ncbi:alpha/beta fold hydrolase [Pseudonocardia sp. CA-107938]|uniref:alpha/beta fold hydrolase n=1 Tax=Pseudonocardia sp. CA-107938 TaxID=3240021 RepID=UPI003D90A8F2
MDQTIEHHRAAVNGVLLHYLLARRSVPRDEAVVLLHGWPETSYAWRLVVPALSARFDVLAPDLRGLGDSQRRGPFDKTTIAQDVRALCDLLGYERLHVVGHDMGAAVAYPLAHDAPDLVASLVVLEMLLPGMGLEEATAIRDGGTSFWHIPFHLAEGGHAEALTHGREEQYLHRYYHDSLYDPTTFSAADRAHYVQAYRAPGAMHAGFEWYRTLFEDARANRRRAQERALDIPVLAIGGAHRMGEQVERSLRRVATAVTGETWQRCGHYPHEEQPDRLVDRLLEFLPAA